MGINQNANDTSYYCPQLIELTSFSADETKAFYVPRLNAICSCKRVESLLDNELASVTLKVLLQFSSDIKSKENRKIIREFFEAHSENESASSGSRE